MRLTADDYERHYRELGDEELLAIDSSELVDVARQCYESELARRQLTEPVEQEFGARPEFPPDPLPMPADEELVQVAIITHQRTAQGAAKLLYDADVPAIVTNTPAATGTYAEGCIGVMVPASCAEAARDLLAAYLTWDNKALVRRWLEKDWIPDGFDECTVTVDDHFGEENKVAARITVAGIDRSSRKEARRAGMAIVHLVDGMIGKRWILLDP